MASEDSNRRSEPLVRTLAATDMRVLMKALQERIDTLDKLIAQEALRRWTVEGVLRADRSLLIDALFLLAAKEHGE